ncbi:MAG: N-acetyl-1-D-myo-inositol-2-amino-2-deoxy-alpha-D-glucopyranoside deacetylase [Corynebacterium sp.]|nr:N-acetyl-1-D-myo-inositol-2-amino-2-deoxy-alpha-D-glucopyranoside deacetylase [Corynebacterium sp.]
MKTKTMRVLAVHAHPDDEAIWTGGLLAHYARQGAEVLVVTCTLGEEGEVIGEPYAQLTVDHANQLGGFRIAELYESLNHLGVQGHHLGGAGHFRDSGMAGTPAAANPRAFVNNGAEAVDLLVDVIDCFEPDLLVTYGPDGGYGHPDHIQAHKITHAAAEKAQHKARAILWAVTSREALDASLAEVTEYPDGWRWAPEEIAAVDSYDLALELASEVYEAKIAAMKAHATQVWIADGTSTIVNPEPAVGLGPDVVWALSNLITQTVVRQEYYQIGYGTWNFEEK